MIYNRITWLCCICLMSILSSTYSQPFLDLRQKLERLLQDSEYNEADNEIHKPAKTYGMLLKDLPQHVLFNSLSKESSLDRLNNFKYISEDSMFSEEEIYLKTTTTTERQTTARMGSTSTITTLGQSPISVGFWGLERLKSMISIIIDVWRQSQ